MAPSDTVEAVTCPRCGKLYPSGDGHTCDAGAETLTCGTCGKTYARGSAHRCADAAPRDGAAPELVGTIISERYEILSQLGQGGMGAVYKARHTVLGSMVAVKVLLHPQDESVRKRFLQEARLASQVRHPNTVYISDFGILPDQRPYLIMEYIKGDTLAALIAGPPLPLLRVLRLTAQICRGLRGRARAGNRPSRTVRFGEEVGFRFPEAAFCRRDSAGNRRKISGPIWWPEASAMIGCGHVWSLRAPL